MIGMVVSDHRANPGFVECNKTTGEGSVMSMMSMTDYYGLLKVPTSAETGKIHKAYRQQAFSCHPDKGGSAEAMVQITEAWKTLSDPIRRERYDRLLFENDVSLRHHDMQTLPDVTAKTRKYTSSRAEFEKIYRMAYETFREDLEGVSADHRPVGRLQGYASGKHGPGLVVRVTVGKIILCLAPSGKESVAGHMFARSEIMSLFIMAMVIGIGTGALMHVLLR